MPSLLDEAKKLPTDYHVHFKLAEHYFSSGQVIPAIAECRTCLAFGGQSREIYLLLAKAYIAAGCGLLADDLINRGVLSAEDANSLQKAYGSDREGLLKLSPARYQRLKAMAARVERIVSGQYLRILDVGGGDGLLCLFLPHAHYVLAEPTVNGLSGSKEFFPERLFDVVVACHVVEHIPDAEKENFLDELCSLAKKKVILLGPVDYDNSTIPTFVYRITEAPWALEHVNCKLPTLDMLKEFALMRALRYEIIPNGDRPAVFWMVFASYYAHAAGKMNELNEVVEYSHRYLNENISNPNQPNDYFVEYYIGNG